MLFSHKIHMFTSQLVTVLYSDHEEPINNQFGTNRLLEYSDIYRRSPHVRWASLVGLLVDPSP